MRLWLAAVLRQWSTKLEQETRQLATGQGVTASAPVSTWDAPAPSYEPSLMGEADQRSSAVAQEEPTVALEEPAVAQEEPASVIIEVEPSFVVAEEESDDMISVAEAQMPGSAAAEEPNPAAAVEAAWTDAPPDGPTAAGAAAEPTMHEEDVLVATTLPSHPPEPPQAAPVPIIHATAMRVPAAQAAMMLPPHLRSGVQFRPNPQDAVPSNVPVGSLPQFGADGTLRLVPAATAAPAALQHWPAQPTNFNTFP
ncbi:MAG: hypothetical protein M0Z66_08765 [Thermaerobacter sp.]|nr:hypothetical protein [Thermaerobacter sp.]